MSQQNKTPPDVAYVYPAPYWGIYDSAWVKSLLLFFDQVAILLPDYMYGRHQAADPTLVEPLEDRGLLQVLEPKKWVDENMANQLAEIVVELLTNGAFDDLPKEKYFHELSQSRIGYSADVGLAAFLVGELRARDLARPSEDGVSIPLHPTVRTTILVILGQLSRAAGSKHGFAIHPTTNHPEAISDLIETLSRQPMPSRGKVITFDLEPVVSLGMDSMPLDDILQFRDDHQDAHRTYMRNLQRFMAELAGIDIAEEREALLLERRQEIADAAHDIRSSTTRARRKNLSWSLGLAGGAWSLGTGDLLGAALAACGLITGLLREPKKVTAYSYLFAVQSKLVK